MSATLDCKEILDFLPMAKCLFVEGRQFPIEIFYLDAPEESYLDAVLHCTLQVRKAFSDKQIGVQIHVDEDFGDILVFLTGEEEIESMAALIRTSFDKLEEKYKKQSLSVLTMYAAMPPEKQMKVNHRI